MIKTTVKVNFARIWCITTSTPDRWITPHRNVYMAKFYPSWEGYPVWQTRLPAATYVIRLKWEIKYGQAGYLITYLGSPNPHVNRPLLFFFVQWNKKTNWILWENDIYSSVYKEKYTKNQRLSFSMYLGGHCRWVPLAYRLDFVRSKNLWSRVTLYRACTRVSIGWWHLRLSAKILALLRLPANFFSVAVNKKIKN